MKRSFILLLFVLCFTAPVFAQYAQSIQKWHLKFETPEKLENYKTESKHVMGYDNDNYAVDITGVPYTEESDSFLLDKMYAANELAKDMKLLNINRGSSVPKIENAYYVTATDMNKKGIVHPLIVLVIFNDEEKMAFEITIDCYNNDIAKGITIARSFEFIP